MESQRFLFVHFYHSLQAYFLKFPSRKGIEVLPYENHDLFNLAALNLGPVGVDKPEQNEKKLSLSLYLASLVLSLYIVTGYGGYQSIGSPYKFIYFLR